MRAHGKGGCLRCDDRSGPKQIASRLSQLSDTGHRPKIVSWEFEIGSSSYSAAIGVFGESASLIY